MAKQSPNNKPQVSVVSTVAATPGFDTRTIDNNVCVVTLSRTTTNSVAFILESSADSTNGVNGTWSNLDYASVTTTATSRSFNVIMNPERPWIRVNVTTNASSDVCTFTFYGV